MSSTIPSHWVESEQVDALGATLRLYTSSKTKLRVVFIDSEGPLVNCYFTLSTEAQTNSYAHKDDGLPHTLEHLVFLGSEKYPYKGVLDKLANRCLAQGTNAWTDTDHTAYTVTTAGSEGFVNLLPIYADHIFFPTMTDDGYITEIHHITGEGEDKGVVYCEMQGRENSAGSLIDGKCMDLLYPEEGCGLASETGGKMHEIRTSLNNEKIRQYHREYYRPDNACLIITGIVDAGEVLNALGEFEQKYLEKNAANPYPKMERPWSTPVSPLTGSASATIRFPSEDESTGTVSVCWRAARFTAENKFVESLARKILWNYLSDSAASPLQVAFVENEDAIAADLGHVSDVHETGYDQLWFSSCPVDRLEEIVPMLEKELLKICDKGFDMSLIKTEIKRYRRKYKKSMENDPADQLLWPTIKHFLYSARDEKSSIETDTLKKYVGVLDQLDIIENEKFTTSDDWVQLLRSAFVDAHKMYVIGLPSAEMAKNMAADEKKRTEDQAKRLGAEKLKELADKLAKAVESNETPPPEDLLSSLPVPDASNLPEIRVDSLHDDCEDDKGILRGEADAAQSLVDHLKNSRQNSALSIPITWLNVNTVFVKLTVFCDTTGMSPVLRHCLPLLCEVAFKLPVQTESVVLSSADVIEALQADTIGYGCNASNASAALGVEFYVQSEREEITTAGKWLRRLMFDSIFDKAELKKAAGKMLKEIPDYKRSSRTLAHALMAEISFSESGSETNINSANFIRRESYLERVMKSLEADDGVVIQEMEECRRQLVKNLRVIVGTDLKEVGDCYAEVAKIFEGKIDSVAKVGAPHESLREYNYNQFPRKAQVMGLSGAENSTLMMCTRGVGAFDDDLPALLVVIEFLTALEGEFWVKIRGNGLSYSYNLSNNTSAKKLTFSLSKAADPVKAIDAAKKIVMGFDDGTLAITETDLESTKSSLIFSIVSQASNKNDAAYMAKSYLFAGKEKYYNKNLMGKLLNVTKEDALEALRKYLVPMFEKNSSALVAVTPLNKVDEIAKSLEGCVVLKEDELSSVFPPLCMALEGSESSAKKQKTNSNNGGGGAMMMNLDWTNVRACDCPKCERPNKGM